MEQVYLVIGGEGFLGYHIVNQLIELKNAQVRVLDLSLQHDRPKVKFYKANICDYSTLSDAFTGVDVVIHTASPIASSRKELFWTVNVKGTENVVKICREKNVKALIFSSSCGVVYDCSPIRNGTEQMPYCEKHIDDYNETKCIAEQLILNSNSATLKTCCLRLAGLFGPKDRQMIPRFIELYKTKQTSVQIGDNTNLFDFTYIENAAYAHILASEKIIDKNVNGNVFIITNDQPIPFWDLPKMVWEKLGNREVLKYRIPYQIALCLSFIVKAFADVISIVKPINITFQPYAIRYACTDRYFDISKSKEILGYAPLYSLKEGIEKTFEDLKLDNKLK